MTKAEFFAVAKIAGWFGLKGFLKIIPYTHSVERLQLLDSIFVGVDAQSAKQYSVEKIEAQQKSVLLKLRDVNDRTSAEQFKNMYVFVDDAQMQEPPKGSYFVHDIIGCTVATEQNKTLGIVDDVLRTPGQDIWVVRSASGIQMIPVAKNFIRHVDITMKKITVRLIDGMMDDKG